MAMEIVDLPIENGEPQLCKRLPEGKQEDIEKYYGNMFVYIIIIIINYYYWEDNG